MKILVTGATGFIGGAVARKLSQQGHEVLGLSLQTTDRPAPLGGVMELSLIQIRVLLSLAPKSLAE